MRLTSTFPLSNYLLKNYSPGTFCLSYLSKELSCHAIETYTKRLQSKEESDKLKVHCYRALLELLIQETKPELKHSALKSVPKCHLMPFKEYALKATKMLDVYIDLEGEKVQIRTEMLLREWWWKVVVFYSLRLFFAPVIETVILLDRSIFLLEKGQDSCLVPIFDPLISPRNHVLLSLKR